MVEETTAITGGCLCGAIRYELSEPPSGCGTCHCRNCQKQSGSAFVVSASFPLSALRFVRGKPKRYQSSSVMERLFCPDCGSSIYFRYIVQLGNSKQNNPDRIWLHLGPLDEPEVMPIEFHYGVESQFSWVHFDDGVSRRRCDEDPGWVEVFGSGDSRVEQTNTPS